MTSDTTSPKRPRGRRPGRPAGGSDPAEQRARLIAIALDLFGRDGYASTTLAGIARVAGMTPAAVHYYFRTREQLLDAIYDDKIAPMRERIGDIFASGDDPVAAFCALAERFVQLADEEPWVGPVFFGELLTDNDLFKQHLRHRVDESRQNRIHDAIKRWQAEGTLNPDLDPALLMPTLLNLTVLPMTARRKWKDDPARAHVDAATIRRHVTALLRHGLGAPPDVK